MILSGPGGHCLDAEPGAPRALIEAAENTEGSLAYILLFRLRNIFACDSKSIIIFIRDRNEVAYGSLQTRYQHRIKGRHDCQHENQRRQWGRGETDLSGLLGQGSGRQDHLRGSGPPAFVRTPAQSPGTRQHPPADRRTARRSG
ncbi:hypothetical protein DESC_770086 [Desulfosarcina cetonica]|nr:hypothetical protein DESC_770086 [Desulfosarcina cetonica]